MLEVHFKSSEKDETRVPLHLTTSYSMCGTSSTTFRFRTQDQLEVHHIDELSDLIALSIHLDGTEQVETHMFDRHHPRSNDEHSLLLYEEQKKNGMKFMFDFMGDRLCQIHVEFNNNAAVSAYVRDMWLWAKRKHVCDKVVDVLCSQETGKKHRLIDEEKELSAYCAKKICSVVEPEPFQSRGDFKVHLIVNNLLQTQIDDRTSVETRATNMKQLYDY
jgi:hypothetical protein